jgi:hypothetical protein
MKRVLEKKKKKEKAFPPAGPLLAHVAAASPPPRPRILPPSAHLRPASARAPARSALRLSLADEPAPPASRSLACSLPLADRPHRSAASSSSPRTARRGHLRPSSPRPSPRRTEKFGTAPSSPLDRVLARYRPAVRSRRRRCAALNSGAVHLTGVRRAPPLPSPRAPIKGRPEHFLAPHRPRPSLSSPRPSAIRREPPSSPAPVSSPPSPLSLSVGPASD